MSDIIVGSIISGFVSLMACMWQHNKTIALLEYRLQELEKKQDKHNGLMERMFKLEQKVADMD